MPVCSAGTDEADCFTTALTLAITKIYGGPVSNGKQLFPGFMPGSEALMPSFFGGVMSSGWMNMIVSPQPDGKSADFGLAENTMRYLVHKPPKPNYNCMTFDFDHDIYMLD